jgi:hypothetical protein
MWFRRVTGQMVAWIGRGGTIAWPPRSPDLTPVDFSVWRYAKDKDFVPPLPAGFGRTTGTDNRSHCDCNADMIHRIWDKIAYRWDMFHVTRGNHVECLWVYVYKS